MIATAQLMVVLDATIVNVALPHVQRALGFSVGPDSETQASLIIALTPSRSSQED